MAKDQRVYETIKEVTNLTAGIIIGLLVYGLTFGYWIPRIIWELERYL